MKQKTNSKNVSDQQKGMKVSLVTLIANFLLSVVKIFAGIFGKSYAMVSDAIHSISDVASTIIVMMGLKMSSKESDKDHPYGHERLESVAAIILAVILFATGVMILISAVEKIIAKDFQIPTLFPLIVAVVSIIVKEWMFHYTMATAKKIKSDSMKADAWHHRSDALSSIGSFVGILGAILGFPILDFLASIVISIIIVKVSISIFTDAIKKMLDHSVPEETLKSYSADILTVDGVEKIDHLSARLFGSKVYMDLEIALDPNLTIKEGHAIAEEVHSKIEEKHEDVKHCMIHVNPLGESENEVRERRINEMSNTKKD